jgi:assimilatory nitrate reductase electron transfer subunit
VCRCNGVSKGDITAHWELGCTDVEAVAAATRATTGCGGCTDDVCGLLAWLERASPPGPPGGEDRFTAGKHARHGVETGAS